MEGPCHKSISLDGTRKDTSHSSPDFPIYSIDRTDCTLRADDIVPIGPTTDPNLIYHTLDRPLSTMTFAWQCMVQTGYFCRWEILRLGYELAMMSTSATNVWVTPGWREWSLGEGNLRLPGTNVFPGK